ncbi:hypothetical protein L218DRAFT_361095 [Marasmius fiardii PR-910]|nr:hypothetical protein L218DRAFT_361095 [Marasmius fiardii PR-910]
MYSERLSYATSVAPRSSLLSPRTRKTTAYTRLPRYRPPNLCSLLRGNACVYGLSQWMLEINWDDRRSCPSVEGFLLRYGDDLFAIVGLGGARSQVLFCFDRLRPSGSWNQNFLTCTWVLDTNQIFQVARHTTRAYRIPRNSSRQPLKIAGLEQNPNPRSHSRLHSRRQNYEEDKLLSPNQE